MTPKTRISDLPEVQGRYTEDAPLGAVGWFRTGGTADVLFKPADTEDLAAFMKACPTEITVKVLGVMSNTIIRDGGVRGVVIRLGRAFNTIEKLDESRLKAGTVMLDANVAEAAAEAGISGLEFLCGIPGTIGGALKMNAGCYGGEIKEVLQSAELVTRGGDIIALSPEELKMSYRKTAAPEGAVFTSCILKGETGVPENIRAKINEIRAQREASQPLKERTGGSTFANPEGYRAWELIDAAGCRGLCVGGAMMSKKHCNFMINTGNATAHDLETLGETVREKVKQNSGIDLRWEIRRIGEHAE